MSELEVLNQQGSCKVRLKAELRNFVTTLEMSRGVCGDNFAGYSNCCLNRNLALEISQRWACDVGGFGTRSRTASLLLPNEYIARRAEICRFKVDFDDGNVKACKPELIC